MSLKLLDAHLQRVTRKQDDSQSGQLKGAKKRKGTDLAKDAEEKGSSKTNYLKKARSDIKARGQRIEQAVKLAALFQPKKKSRKLLKKIVKLQRLGQQ